VPIRTSSSACRRGSLRGRGLLALTLAPVLALTACTSSTAGHGTAVRTSAAATPSPSSTSSTTAAAIAFSDCKKAFNLGGLGIAASRMKNLTFSCGKVAVPLNYDDPQSATINIEVVKVHDSRQPEKIGSLLMNPGGPGAAGITLPIDLLSSLSDKILDNFDLIGFDPRGVEVSSPIDCISDKQKDVLDALDPDVRTAAGFAEAKRDDDTIAQACAAAYGPELADYNTLFTAMDMDRIRQALGDAKLNYLGFSYGTRLGAVYAHLYPTRIRVAVLDGAVDPTTDEITSFANQLQGFEGAFDQFAADCLKRAACAVLGNPRQVVYQLTAQANAVPIKSSQTGETRTATGAIVLTGVLSALYNQSQWTVLGDALVQARKGDSAGLFALADQYNERDSKGSYSNIFDANTTISCNDVPPGPSDAVIRSTAAVWATRYPMFGVWSAGSLFSCQSWPASGHTLPATVTAAGSPPILVVGTIHDPATPYAGAVHLAAALTTGHLLTWNGQGHTAYTKSTCVDGAVDTYLVSAQLPAAGTVCPA
jgi:pimeloyl-ACP methyl ester carboxylesterase